MIDELNFFKIPIQLYYKNSTMHSHWSGLIGTIAFTSMFVCVLIFFGMDFYLRENPAINIFKREIEGFNALFEKVDHDPKLVVGIDKEIEDRVLFAFINYKFHSEFMRPKCSPEDLEERVKDQIEYLSYYCFDLKSMQIEFDVRNVLILTDCGRTDLNQISGYDQLDLSQCGEATEGERRALFEYLIHFYYPKANLNMNNYLDPISYTYQAFTASFQENKIISSVMQSQFLDINDDKGWIFKDESSNYGINSTFYLENTTATQTFYDYRVTLSFFSSVETNKRIYTKIQNLAAEVGGFLKAILIVIRLPLDFICHHSMKSSFIKDFMTNDNLQRLKNAVSVPIGKDNVEDEVVRFGRISSENKDKSSELVKPNGKRKSITGKLVFFKIFKFCRRTSTQGEKTLLRAEHLMKKVFSVENMFKSYFEQDIVKRMLLSEQDMKILCLARRPDIYDHTDLISERYFREPLMQEKAFGSLDKESVLATASEPFEKVIRDYL